MLASCARVVGARLVDTLGGGDRGVDQGRVRTRYVRINTGTYIQNNMDEKIQDPEKNKICSQCQTKKSISDFHKDRRNVDGLSGICKQCKRAYRISPAYRERERELERTPEYKARKKKYFASVKGKSYKSREHHIYKSRDKVHTLTYLQWQYIISMQNNRCAICNTPFSEEIPPVRDCMIPLSKGGSLTLGNTQAVCCRCNSVKGTKAYCGTGNRWRGIYIG